MFQHNVYKYYYSDVLLSYTKEQLKLYLLNNFQI